MPGKISKLVLSAAVAVAFASCRTESISEFGTNEVTANITASTEGKGSTAVSATFRKGPTSLTFLQLTADDSVTASAGASTEKMAELSLLGVVTYSASLPVDADGTQVTVALARKKDSGAPSSVATLPQGFSIDPVSGSFSRATGGPNLHWSNAGTDPMKLTISGTCIDSLTASLPAGSTDFSVAAAALKKKQSSGGADGGTSVEDNCTATAQIDRTRAGTLDTGYAGGSISGVQRRSVTFTTAP